MFLKSYIYPHTMDKFILFFSVHIVAFMFYYFSGDCHTSNSCIIMPPYIKRSVQQQNIRFLHTRSQYTEEYFKFIRNIATINSPNIVPPTDDLQQLQIVSP